MGLGVTPGVGQTLATDLVTAEHYEFLKLVSAEVGSTERVDKDSDTVWSTGHVGIGALGVVNEAGGTIASGGLRYVPAARDTKGDTYVVARSALPVTFSGSMVVSSITNPVTVTGAVDVTPASPAAGDYLPVRLTDGSAFYTATGGGGGGSATEYTEGAVDATITGVAVMWEDTGDTLRAVSAAKPLPVAQQGTVNVADGGGTLTVDGTVGVSGTVAVSATQLPAALVGGRLDQNVGAWGGTATTLGQKAMASSVPVVIASDQGALTVASHAVDTELPAASALADNAANPTAPAVGAFGMLWDGLTWDRAAGTSADGALVNLGANNDVTITGVVPVNDNGGSLTVDNAGTFAVQAGQVAQDAVATGNPVLAGLRASDAEPTAMSADGDAVFAWGDRSGRFVTTQKAATATLTNVAGSATSVALLAANTARVGVIVHNDSTATLFVKFGATASSSSYTYRVEPNATLELPFGYTGQLDAIWSSAAGNARVTELT